MAATVTLEHSAPTRNSRFQQNISPIIPRNGVVTLYGYGINVRVQRGHLVCEDGIGSERRFARFPRVAHGLRRLVVIGADGMVSLAALRWLADQDAAFVMLERDGRVLATTGPVRSCDARLRRAQSLAAHTGANIVIAKYLISHKLAAQERVTRCKLQDFAAAGEIAEYRRFLEVADSLAEVRDAETRGASIYWAAWRDVRITFPNADLPRVPEHWRTFGSRKSPISGSRRLAVNPPNAMLNYLYAVLESESRLAAATLGLDPGIGFVHFDTPHRDSLACDLMEPVRPIVDAFVLDWIRRGPLKREWFFEERSGNCRLMGSFTAQLSEAAEIWARSVAPYVEWVAHTLWAQTAPPAYEKAPATRLTQRRKREAKGSEVPPRFLASHG